MQHIQFFLIVNQQSLQNSLHASGSHLLLVVAAQAVLMACLEHQNLQKITPRWSLNVCTWHWSCLNLVFLQKKRMNKYCSTLLISLQCLAATTLTSEKRAFTSELLWNKDDLLSGTCREGCSTSLKWQTGILWNLKPPTWSERGETWHRELHIKQIPCFPEKKETKYQSVFPTRVQISTIWVTTVRKH